MMLFVYIGTALKQLAQNKGRSMLTMLGIIIGIGSVIFIMTLGEVAKNFLLSQISQFGTNVIEVTLPSSFGLGESQEDQLTEDDVTALYESSLLPELSAVSAGYTVQKNLDDDGNSTPVSVFGDRPEFFDVNNLNIVKGRFFTQADYDNATRVIVVDEKVSRDLFDTTDVVGKRIKIGGTYFTVIGVMEELGFGQGSFGVSMVYAPLTTVRQLFVDADEQNVVTFFLIQFEPGTDPQSFQNRVSYILRQQHGFTDEEEDPFVVLSRDQALGILDSILLGVQAFVSAVAAISLFVGGIGIMNIMLVTVKERTKEIGLRKAIGAKHSSILTQFLVESIVLTTVGGIIGILLGLGLSLAAVVAVNAVKPDWEVAFVFVPDALVIACGVAVTVGLIFGLYPALKASKLHPIEALRYE